MPRIILKHKSPEYADTDEEKSVQHCDMPGCTDHGTNKAPKHRGLDEYHYFCTAHVQEYNKAWDFFSGMSERDVQDHVKSSLYGDRPTWKYGIDGDPEEVLYKAARQTYDYNERPREKEKNGHRFSVDTNTPEHQAMAVMGLSPPLTLEEIKVTYKKLAKKYHPDLNRDNPDAEELLKSINMAYTILKLAFEQYEKLPNQ